MSDEINKYDVQEGRFMGWHKKTEVNPNLSIDNCKLNTWDYIAKRVTVEGIETAFSVLGVTDVPELLIGRPYVTKSFKPVFNKRLLELAKPLEDKGLTLQSSGTVMNRGRQFLSFSMDGARFQAANRPFVSYLNIGNGNDMSSVLWTNTSNACTVCNNTFTLNMDDKGMIMKVKKTQFSELKLVELEQALDAMLRGQAKFAKTLNELASIPCDENMAKELFAGFIGEPGKALSDRSNGTVESLVRLFKTGLGNDGNDFSDVFQAMTDFYTHEAANGQDTVEAKWKNHLSSEFGSGKENKIRAFDMISNANKRDGLILIGREILKTARN